VQATWILLIVLVLVVAGGGLYLFRPGAELPEVSVAPEASPSPIDTTITLPILKPTSSMITPIAQTVRASFVTNRGTIELELDGAAAPTTVGNFVALAQKDFYDGTTFHRVIPNFMIQAGDPLSRDPALRARHGTGGPGYVFEDEINSNKIVRGSLAMANAGPGTNGSQFFIVTAAATPHLDGMHTNFGKVTKGMEVVDAISKVATDDNDNPVEAVVITDVVIHNTPRSPLQVEE
jgi:cyclophilin family peptidyl-prolyl cis-trans isomerase